ncbi:MAG: hypothetical protein JO191_02725 [Mycobacteriaceae bacterium]|nr:hypothetical protein [Mycobacteriaceae bacterium]
MPEDTARALLSQGYPAEHVAHRSGLPLRTVREIARTVERPDVSALVDAVHERLHDLGISVLAASKMGLVSRSTLATLGRDGRAPSDSTLAKLDELLSWAPGSAKATLFGQDPVAREAPQRPHPPPPPDPNAHMRLARAIEQRLRELNMSKSKFAAIGGPGRSTLATLGKRGFHPAAETLERIDRFLLWEPGSAQAVLNGGFPVRHGPSPTPHPALVPLNAILDRQRRLLAQVTRWEQSLAQMKTDITEAINHAKLAISDLNDFSRPGVLDDAGEPAANGHRGDDTDTEDSSSA